MSVVVSHNGIIHDIGEQGSMETKYKDAVFEREIDCQN